MNVSSVQSTAAAAATGAVKSSNAVAGPAATASTSTGDVFTSKIAAIAAKYDPTRISASQVPDLGKELYSNGLVSAGTYVDMMAFSNIEKNLEKEGMSLGGWKNNSDGTVDVLSFWQSRLGNQKTADSAKEVTNAVHTLQDLSSFRDAQSNSDTSGLDIKGAVSAYNTSIKSSTLDVQQVVSVLESLVTNRG